jgi:hypothetical protein
MYHAAFEPTIYCKFTLTPQMWFGLGLWCLTSLSTICQLYHGSQLLWWRKSGVPWENHRPVILTFSLIKIECLILYTPFTSEPLLWSGPSRSYSTCSWIYNYLCNQNLSPLPVIIHWQNLSHNVLLSTYTLPWMGFKLTTLVVIGSDCTDNCKFNYMYYMIVTAIKQIKNRLYF